ncbi:MAG: PAS domain S-box protein [bacterium]
MKIPRIITPNYKKTEPKLLPVVQRSRRALVGLALLAPLAERAADMTAEGRFDLAWADPIVFGLTMLGTAIVGQLVRLNYLAGQAALLGLQREGELREGTTQRLNEALADLQTEKAKFEELFNNTPIGNHVVDNEGNIVEISNSWLRTMGYEREEVVGRHFSEFLIEEQRANAIARFEERRRGVLENQMTPKEGPRQYLHKDGNIVYAETFNSRRADGGFQTSLKDITSQVKTEEELSKAKDSMQAAEIEAAMGHLAKAISHPLKNRLFVLGGSLREQHILIDQLKSILSSLKIGDSLSAGQLRALLDVTYVIFQRLGQFDLQLDNVNSAVDGLVALGSARSKQKEILPVAVLIADQITHLRKISQAKNVTIDLTIEELPDRAGIEIAESNLRYLVSQLVLNAMEAEASEVRVTLVGTDDAVILRVIDNGSGMSAARMAEVAQGQAVESHKPDGSGLGLLTIRSIVQDAKGRMRLESCEGGPTTATFVFPKQQVSELPKEKQVVEVELSEAQKAATRILVVDDDPDILALVELVLLRAGFSNVEMSSGFKTKEALRQKLAEFKPTVVLSDQTMPGSLQGQEVVDLIVDELPDVRCLVHSGITLRPEDPLVNTLRHPRVSFVSKSSKDKQLIASLTSQAAAALGLIS